EVFDDAQLGLHFLLQPVELVHLAHLRVELLDILVELVDLAVERGQPPPLDNERNDHDQQRDGGAEGDERQLLAAPDGALGLLRRREIERAHWPPGRRPASPSATATSDARRGTAAASSAGLTMTWLTGSVTSTGASTRSPSRCANSGVCAAPPLR